MQGLVISVFGSLLGLLLGLLAAHNINELLNGFELLTGMHLLDGSFFVKVPIHVEYADLLQISGFSIALSLLSGWHPAKNAAQINPVEVLH